MASRLDPIRNEIFQKLADEGQSYRTVAAWVRERGIAIAMPSLRSWFLRKCKKIEERMSVVAPTRGAPSSSSVAVGAVTNAPITLASSTQPTQPVLSLKEQIDLEERVLRSGQGSLARAYAVRGRSRDVE